ncbi:vesicle transport through interaction with t-SNAREs homolog 1A [Zeugodacus cucurbitae]|uniref:vesicle transport through interaction with t-SNAREs homolog 1A n=1 Tax=Zeugodacus cucurbitae TaxID=28588 RepID=UPI0005969862|nr:vesicle transport through interaction with t-SNAREs homolog 1A [Zeugodacus cucurbitae]
MILLEQYEQQYAVLIAEITSEIAQLKQLKGAERRDLSSKIDGSLAEAHELLEQMTLEIRDIDAALRPSFQNKVSCAQVELKRLQNDYRNAKEAQQKQHMTVLEMGGGDCDYYDDVSIGNDQRQHLLENSERIERTGNRLADGYRVALETEALGAHVLNDLSHQREVLQGARSRLRETNADLGRASRTLNTMMLRALREKAVLYVVGVCFVVAVGVSLYLTFSSSAPTAK